MRTGPIEDDLLRPADIAAQYRICANHVRGLVASGELRCLRVGHRILIPRWVVRDYIAANLTPVPEKPPSSNGGSAASPLTATICFF